MKTTLQCPQCHNQVSADDTFCGNCRHRLKADAPGAVSPTATPAQTSPQATAQNPGGASNQPVIAGPVEVQGNAQRNGMSTAAMVMGLIVFFTMPISFFIPLLIWLYLIAGIVAIILGAISHSSQHPKRATVGIVLSSLTVSGIIFLISISVYAVANCERLAGEDSTMGSFCQGYIEGRAGTNLQPYSNGAIRFLP